MVKKPSVNREFWVFCKDASVTLNPLNQRSGTWAPFVGRILETWNQNDGDLELEFWRFGIRIMETWNQNYGEFGAVFCES